MTIEKYLATRLEQIIEIARLAPSVHNTQPWIVTAQGSKIQVAIDPAYELHEGDPTGRQTIISLGIFAEAIRIGAENKGLRVKSLRFDENTAVVECAFKPKKRVSNQKEVRALHNRCTDRSIYTSANITPKMVGKLKQRKRNITVHVINDAPTLQTIAELTSKGIRLALSNPAFRKELSQYLILPWSGKSRGIAVRSLYIPWALEIMEPTLMRLGIGLDTEAKLEKQRWLSASAVVIITSRGDMPDYWFEVGRAYLQVSLAVEELGLSQATSAAIVEASTFHEDIEKLLKTNQRIQSVIRIGNGSSKRNHSPRVAAKELIST